jgi:hypothetical protein
MGMRIFTAAELDIHIKACVGEYSSQIVPLEQACIGSCPFPLL